MDKFTLPKTRLAIGAVVGISVNFVVAGAISHIVPVETKTQKVKLFIGSYAISAMVADKVANHTDRGLREILESVQEAWKHAQENANEEPDLNR